MSGPSIRLYTDEDVNDQVAGQLGRFGYDTLSCADAGNAHQQLSDEWQLQFAVRSGRAILTHNIADFVALDAQWRSRGHEHWGIVLVPQETPLSELIRRTRRQLTQEQRRGWVDLLLTCADETGIPEDPEFRSALVAYLEWGSRIAVLNSQPGVAPPPDSPMPVWGWGEVKGPYTG